MQLILSDIGQPDIAQEILSLWLEYEDGGGPEAKLARELDKLEMIVQANEYEEANPGKRLERFFTSTKDSFTHAEPTAWATVVRQQHYQRFNENIPVTDLDKKDGGV
jgi:putative hydrolase of HD superfamily